MFFFLFLYTLILCSICASSLCHSAAYLPSFLYFHIFLFHTALLPFSSSTSLSLLLCFSILQLLNQYPPHYNVKHYCQWSNPRVSLLVDLSVNLTGRQKEKNPEKKQQIPPRGELRLVSCLKTLN